MTNIPFGKPMIGDVERDAMTAVLRGTTLTHGPKCAEFETAFADYVGVKHAISTSNCTTAIHLGLIACGVGFGDEVIVPAMTHVATAHAVEHCGAVPIFVDIDIETGCIDPKLIEEKITQKTKVIIVVHFIGLPCDMASINAVAEKYNIDVIEDSATALGAKHNNKFAGSLGKLGCFSFYPTKHITSLEGGMLTTDDDHVAAKVRSQRAFGYDKGLGERQIAGVYDIASLGWNYRMSEGHAAVGHVQLSKLPYFLEQRKKNAERLVAELCKISGLSVMPPVHKQSHSSWYCVNIIVSEKLTKSRNELVGLLNAEGIGTSVHYPVALPHSKYYSQKYPIAKGKFSQAQHLAANTISLPCGPHVSDQDIVRIIEKINEILSP
ncbi:MAG: hypothetical protein CBB97_21415 [Candidatus Endolissoclinum sp. TMED37]|nr:MAG: hypothetical protein CBB97_21415 [Candidatus Endolissoclinum sp. TMED37]